MKKSTQVGWQENEEAEAESRRTFLCYKSIRGGGIILHPLF
jgi:hypothetical protein